MTLQDAGRTQEGMNNLHTIADLISFIVAQPGLFGTRESGLRCRSCPELRSSFCGASAYSSPGVPKQCIFRTRGSSQYQLLKALARRHVVAVPNDNVFSTVKDLATVTGVRKDPDDAQVAGEYDGGFVGQLSEFGNRTLNTPAGTPASVAS